MKKYIALILMLVLCMGLIAACSNTAAADPTPTPASTPDSTPGSAEPEFVSFTDSVGRTVEVPSNVTRISPSGTLAQMFMLAIAPDLMVTVASEYTDKQAPYIPEYVLSLPHVGQFYGTADINFETIASVNPEIVIDVGEPKDTVIEDMDEIMSTVAIPSVHITATLRSTPDAFRTLGKLLGREEKGEQLAQFCEKVLEQSDGIMAKVGDNKQNALYCLGDTGQNVIAANSYHSEMLDYIMNNLAVVDNPSSRGLGNETDLEQISVWAPEFIIFGNTSVYDDVATDASWSTIPAVQNGQYIKTPYGPYDWIGNPPSINRYLSLIWLPKAMYPEYAEYDMYAQIKEYYSLFYGFDLSEENYNELTANAFVK